jgi:hypothetical protein
MYDRALNFLLFKVVFVGAILEPRWEELLIWIAWFTILGFLRVFSMLCRDRFEYVRHHAVSVVHRRQYFQMGFSQKQLTASFCLLVFAQTVDCVTQHSNQSSRQDPNNALHDLGLEHYLVCAMHFRLSIHAFAAFF